MYLFARKVKVGPTVICGHNELFTSTNAIVLSENRNPCKELSKPNRISERPPYKTQFWEDPNNWINTFLQYLQSIYTKKLSIQCKCRTE